MSHASQQSSQQLFPTPEQIDLHQGELFYFPQFFAADEGRKLFLQLLEPGAVDWRQDHIRMYGKKLAVPRLTAWYGDSDKPYSYSGIRLEPKIWTAALIRIRTRLEAFLGTDFSSVLLNLYRDGQDSVAWHSDDEPELGKNPVIASVSLGASREFHLRHKNRRDLRKLILDSGSLLVMRGETQHYWEHRVPKCRESDQMGRRINLTFRRIHPVLCQSL